MNLQNAKEIGQKARAYEHCVKLLRKIDKQGSATMKINCTGIEFVVKKGDGIYLRLTTTLSALAEELSLITAQKRSAIPSIPPVCAAPDEDIRRERAREYRKIYYAKHREHLLAQQKEYRKRKTENA